LEAAGLDLKDKGVFLGTLGKVLRKGPCLRNRPEHGLRVVFETDTE
jgi:hypothetical protein